MTRPDGEPWTLAAFTEGAETTAVWSVVDFSALSSRVDAEYYQPSFVEFDRVVRIQGQPLADIFVDVIQPPEFIREYVSNNKGAQFWRAQNVRKGYITAENVEYISWDIFQEIGKSHVREGDVLITRTGANAGDCAVVPSGTSNVAVSSHTLRLVPQDIEIGYAVGAFFASDYGHELLLRTTSGSSRPQITIEILNSLVLPNFQSLKGIITQLTKEFYSKQKESKTLYAEAEALLLDALGLEAAFETDADAPLTYTQSASRAWGAGRLDAEYYQPRYQRAMAKMAQSGKTIGDVATLAKRRFEPKSGRPFQYIEIGDVGQYGHAESSTIPGAESPSRAQWIVKAGDVITSTVRPIRRLSALIEPEQEGYVCTSGFAVLKPTAIEPEVLLVYLRLPVVCEILDLHTSASMYPAISTGDLLNIPIALAPADARAKVVECVRASHNARQDAYRLLEEAKARVEALVLGEQPGTGIKSPCYRAAPHKWGF